MNNNNNNIATNSAYSSSSRATQRQNRANVLGGGGSGAKYRAGADEVDDGYEQQQYDDHAGGAASASQRHPNSAGRISSRLNSTTSSRLEKRASSRSAGPSAGAKATEKSSAGAGSNRTNRLLSSHQYTGAAANSNSNSSSSTTYSQPDTPLDLLRQPLVVLDPNIRIEKFNEDKGDLEAKSRTPSVKVMTKRDPARLQQRSSSSSSGSGANTPLSAQTTTERPKSNNSQGSVDDFANTGSYQPRVPSRKAAVRGATSRVATSKRKTATVSRHQNSDMHSARSHHSQDEYAPDNYSAGSSRGSTDDTGNYTEFTSQRQPARAAPTRRAPSVKRAPSARSREQESKGGYSASRYGGGSNRDHQQDEYAAPPATKKKSTSAYPSVASAANPFGPDSLPDDAYPEDEVERIPCAVCGRSFAADRLDKHQRACKNASKPRKKFDISKQRLDAEARQAARHTKPEPEKKREMPANKMPKWKRDHLHFQQVLRAGRPQQSNGGGGSGGGGRNAAPPYEEEIMDDRVPCPHCGRKFNADVADRHIPRCKNIINKPKTIRRGQGMAGGVSALNSRTAATSRAAGGISSTRRVPSTTSTRRTTSRIRR